MQLKETRVKAEEKGEAVKPELIKAMEPVSRRKVIVISSGILFALIVISLVVHYLLGSPFAESFSFMEIFSDWRFLEYALVGFLAQMIDGALGMAYGVTSTSFLMSFGVSPAAASAGVHVSKVFTSGVSGWAHYQFGNVNKKLFKKLILPGMIGAIAGALLLSYVDGKAIKPFVSAYLVVMGIMIIQKAFKKITKKKKTKNLGPLGFVGGFVDSIGGGGWGPVVTSTLLSRGRNPKYTIGSVNLAEFFVAIASAATFVMLLELDNWLVVFGLIAGGVLAAPLAALVVGKVKPKYLMIVVGALIILLSVRNIVLAIAS